MNDLKKYTKAIYDLTLRIEQEYPELYKHLEENPVTINNISHPHLDTKAFAEYLDYLQGIIDDHIKTRKKPGR